MRRLVLLVLLLLAVPARADNDPVLDVTTRQQLAAELAEATEVQSVCYGYELSVLDGDDDGIDWSGMWAVSNLGENVSLSSTAECARRVELHVAIEYTSEWSENEDNASWEIQSTLAGVSTAQLKRLALNPDDLLDDGKSETTLLNAVLALPVLVADAGLAPPVVQDPSDLPSAPADAQATGRPGSDWWRENGATFWVLVGLVLLAALWMSTTTPTGHRRARAVFRAMRS